ncbi:MAG: putative sporulation protein YtxC [Clostridia bacterium]|nr:putative sporulation protein YtxC [Clostridia bacterium]
MKSIALKTNNSQTIDYLQNELLNFNMDNVYFTSKQFKHYNNFIIHYKGNNEAVFINKVASLLSFLVIYEFEEDFLKNSIYKNYFYFSSHEREIILSNCYDIMVDSKDYLKNKYNILFSIFKSYLINNNKIFLNGFINFRLQQYHDLLDSVVNEAVNSFIIEKEYQEFISMLKLYINSQNCNSSEIHVVYSNDFTLILDENKNIIENSNKMLNAKFLSDITFSTNDYTLNTLLNELPEKLYIHLINNTIDEFIRTLTLIFDKRVVICNDCNICNLYKKNILSKK